MKEQQIHLRVSPEEYNLIRQKMKLSGCVNMSAHERKIGKVTFVISSYGNKNAVKTSGDLTRRLIQEGAILEKIFLKISGIDVEDLEKFMRSRFA